MGLDIVRMAPPIEKSNGELRTFVAKLIPKGGHALDELMSPLKFFATQEIIGGIAGVAIVMHGGDAYVVHTLAKPATLGNHTPGFKRRLMEFYNGAIAMVATIEWVRPLNRHLQRLFGWGDINVADVAAEVKLAAEDEDFGRIRKLVPEFTKYTDDEMMDTIHLLPHIVSRLLNPTAAILDCDHQWIEHCGPCQSDPCLSRHAKTWNKCSVCSKVRCGFCVSVLKSRAAEDDDVKEHVEALNGEIPFLHQLHPQLGRPFSVVDSAKMPNAEKMEWIRAEFEPASSEITLDDLPEFCKMCKEFFHCTTVASQKIMVFALFEEFSKIPIGKEASLSPILREKLSEIWGEKLKLCRECGKQTENGRFCGLSCEVAFCKQQFRCTKCNHLQGPRPRDIFTVPCLGDDSRFITVAAHVCKGCNHQPSEVSMSNARNGYRKVYKTPLEDAESLEHAWKRRRRAA